MNPVAETKNGNSTPYFAKNTTQLVSILKAKSPSDIAQLLHISEDLSQLNYKRFQKFSSRYSTKNSAAAVFLFAGDVYRGLDIDSWTEDQVLYSNDKLRILSGLYGIVKPLDNIQPYRLEMGTRLENPNGSNLYHFWNSSISKKLNTDLRGHQQKVVVNLASKEYFTAISKADLKYPILDVDFKEWRNGKLKVISFNAKRARGIMAKYIIQQQIETVDGVAGFSEEGYKLDESSTESHLLFVK